MIKFCNERVVSFSRDYLDFYWEVEPTNDDLQEYQFYVERSEAEAGPWVQVAGPLLDRFYVRDDTIPTLSNSRLMFYRIRALHAPSGRELFSRVTDRDRYPDLIALEIIRLEQVLWREHAGTKFWLFPRRTFGQRCPQCYDPVLGKRTQDYCATCFNSTFSGGYHYPVSFWGQMDEPENAEQVTIDDHREVKYYVVKLGPTPFVKPTDMVIDHLNRRFRVISVGGTNKLGSPVQQMCRVVQVQKGSVEDKVPLKINEGEEILRPQRNYTNPQHLETPSGILDADVDRILSSLYRYTP